MEEHKRNMILFRKTFASLDKSRNLESIKFQDTKLIPHCRGLLNPADKGSPVSVQGAVACPEMKTASSRASAGAAVHTLKKPGYEVGRSQR